MPGCLKKIKSACIFVENLLLFFNRCLQNHSRIGENMVET